MVQDKSVHPCIHSRVQTGRKICTMRSIPSQVQDENVLKQNQHVGTLLTKFESNFLFWPNYARILVSLSTPFNFIRFSRKPHSYVYNLILAEKLKNRSTERVEKGQN